MSFVGDLERLFASSLYPLRLPIAIILAVVFALVARRAYRERWDLVARRHPRRATAIIVPLLAVGLPLGWYFASPLFITVELNEPAPIVSAAQDQVSTTGSSASSSPAGSEPTASPTDTPAAEPTAQRTKRSGEFTGADEFHFGHGTAMVIEATPGTYVVRFENFSVRNGPDLYVYLSPSADGYASGAIEVGRLEATDGNFNQDVPTGTDVSKVKSVVIWCKQFSVQFAVAPLG